MSLQFRLLGIRLGTLLLLGAAIIWQPGLAQAADHTIAGAPNGFSTNLTLTANVQAAPADVGRNGALYVGAVVNGGFFFLKSDGSWNAWQGGPIPVYQTAVLGTHAIPVVTRADLSGLPGTEVYAGYGLDEADLIANQKFARIFTVPAYSTPLSAARNLVGTWKTSFPTTVYYDTDWCSYDPALVASQPWNFTFVITAGQDDNHVNVEMSFGTGAFTVINGCPGTGIIPEVSPLRFTGTISSSRLLLTSGTQVVGEFNFTSDILTGTFDYTWSAVYSQREYTATNTLILRRQ
jgi:hypothetical protein